MSSSVGVLSLLVDFMASYKVLVASSPVLSSVDGSGCTPWVGMASAGVSGSVKSFFVE